MGNFRQDILVEDENGAFLFKETYRRILFRVQGAPEPPFEYEKGIITSIFSTPRCFVVNASYHSEYSEHKEATETTITFFESENLSEFHSGDYIFDARSGIVRKVLNVDDTDPAFLLLNTEFSHMDEAELNFEFGPELGLELELSYDIGGDSHSLYPLILDVTNKKYILERLIST